MFRPKTAFMLMQVTILRLTAESYRNASGGSCGDLGGAGPPSGEARQKSEAGRATPGDGVNEEGT